MDLCNYFAVELAVATRRATAVGSALACVRSFAENRRSVAGDPLGRDRSRSPRERPGPVGVRCDRPSCRPAGVESMRGRGWLVQTLHGELIMGLGWDERVSRPVVFHLPMRRTVTAPRSCSATTDRCSRPTAVAHGTHTTPADPAYRPSTGKSQLHSRRRRRLYQLRGWWAVLARSTTDLIESGKLSRRARNRRQHPVDTVYLRKTRSTNRNRFISHSRGSRPAGRPACRTACRDSNRIVLYKYQSSTLSCMGHCSQQDSRQCLFKLLALSCEFFLHMNNRGDWMEYLLLHGCLEK